jgi:hypothetical protein
MLKKGKYQDIITQVSEQIAKKIIAEEKYLAQRATVIDKDIQDIVQEVGRQTTQKVLEETRDKIVLKKKLPA